MSLSLDPPIFLQQPTQRVSMSIQNLLLGRPQTAMMTGEFGLRRLEAVIEFADRLDRRAASQGGAEPGLIGDLRRAAQELRHMVVLVRSAMDATEDAAVVS